MAAAVAPLSDDEVFGQQQTPALLSDDDVFGAYASPQPAFPANASVKSNPAPQYGFAADAAHQATGGIIDKLAAAAGATIPALGPNVVANDPTWTGRYQKTLQNIRGGLNAYENTNPNGAYNAKAVGVVGPMLVGAGEASPLINALKGSAIGGAYGFGGTNDTSLPDDAAAIGEGALLGGTLAGAGHGVGTIGGAGAGSLVDALSGNAQASAQRSAAAMLQKAMDRQGISPSDLVTQLSGTAKPITAMDIGGENSPLQRLGRTMVTLPGQQSQDITDFLNTRQEGQRGRVLGDISALAPNTNTYDTAADLRTQRSVNSDPLYQKAFANAGVGPVDYDGARNDLISATSQKGSIAKQIKAIDQNNPGALISSGAAGANTRANYMDLHQQLQNAEAARQAAASKFQDVQAGVSALEGNQPLTDSRLADFMQDPDIQAGMRTGLNIQRRLSLANGEDFDPNAYAITHYNDAGQPVVGPVPTWKTLHAGRMGLDNTIYSQADPLTGKLPQTQEMQSLQALRGAYSNHLQTLNPDLAAADAAWSTPSQNLDAMQRGQQFMRADPEQITAALGRLPAEAQSHYQIGAGRQLQDVANDTSDNRNIPLRLANDQTSRDQLISAFGQQSAQDFSNNMSLEKQLAQTRQFVTGNSSTANKGADIADANQPGVLGQILADAVKGGLTGGVHGAVSLPAINLANKTGSKFLSGLMNNEPRNLALANVITGTGPQGAQNLTDLLAPAQNRARTIGVGKTVGGALGRGAGSMLIPALMAPAANNTAQ